MKCPELSGECPELTEEQAAKLFLVSGRTHLELAEDIAAIMEVDLGRVELRTFPDGDLYARYTDSVRGKDVVIMQTSYSHEGFSVNDSLQETLLLGDAARRASARSITVVAPHLPYARQDRKAKGREPISVGLAIRQLALVADRIVCVDMHSQQTQAVFNDPFDHLTAEPILGKALEEYVNQGNPEDFVVVSPDTGRAKTAERYADDLGVDLVHMPKSRSKEDSSQIVRPKKIAAVAGRTCLIIDDMVDTAGTLVSAAETLKNSDARTVIAAATHGLLSYPALDRLGQSPIDKLIVTDTVPTAKAEAALGERLQVVTVAPIIGRALVEIMTDGSVSKLFGGQNCQ